MTAIKTALLAGGDSPEREVSLAGGELILAALQRADINVFAFDTAARSLTELADLGVSRVFNILHGGAGENGEVQGALKIMRIPFTGSGVLASALAMDKHRAKMIWRAAGLPTPDWRITSDSRDASDIASAIGLPLFVKPSCGGSSTNSGVANTTAELAAAIAVAASEGAPAMAEKFVFGAEYTATILNDVALPLIKITPPGDFYDYHAKYISDDTRFICPCGLPAAQEESLRRESLQAFAILGCRHWGRVDFVLGENGPMFLEVNTVPGMTSHSLVPMAAKAAGTNYDSLVKQIWEGAR